MTMAQSDFPKMHMIWYSAQRGFSNDDGDKKRLYYGKTYRIPAGLESVTAIEQSELDDLQGRFIDSSCVEGGTPVIGEVFERYDMHDPDSGDLIVTYRVPYKPSDKSPSRPATMPSLSRRARRAGANKRQLQFGAMAVPPNASQETRRLIGQFMRLLIKHAPDRAFRLSASLAAEQRALALMTVAAHELSSMPPSPQRQAIITQMGAFLGWLVADTDNLLPAPVISKDDLEELEERGIAKRVDLGSDDTDKTH